MKNLLQETQTYSFFEYDELMYYINNKLPENITSFHAEKQVSVLESGEELFIWVLIVTINYV